MFHHIEFKAKTGLARGRPRLAFERAAGLVEQIFDGDFSPNEALLQRIVDDLLQCPAAALKSKWKEIDLPRLGQPGGSLAFCKKPENFAKRFGTGRREALGDDQHVVDGHDLVPGIPLPRGSRRLRDDRSEPGIGWEIGPIDRRVNLAIERILKFT